VDSSFDKIVVARVKGLPQTPYLRMAVKQMHQRRTAGSGKSKDQESFNHPEISVIVLALACSY
jgi:hypothetical protein